MKKFLIIVEGKADVPFLVEYLTFLNNSFQIIKDELAKKRTIILRSNNVELKILIARGYTAIEKVKMTITEYNEKEYNVLVIQDADNPEKSHGGVKERLQYLESVKETHNLRFNTFLFPNNEDNGDLETLLLRIANKDNYSKFYYCYENFYKCISSISEDKFSKELLEDKNKVYNYFRTHYGMENAKEESRKYEKDYWDLHSEELKALKNFLEEVYS